MSQLTTAPALHRRKRRALQLLCLLLVLVLVYWRRSQHSSVLASFSLQLQYSSYGTPRNIVTPAQSAQLQQAAKQSRHLGNMTIATGAGSFYFRALQNLVGSVRFWCPDCHVVIFDLGLTEAAREKIPRWCKTELRWAGGVSAQAAPLLKNLKKWAWKPLAIQEAVEAYGAVLWLDAGSTVTGVHAQAIHHSLCTLWLLHQPQCTEVVEPAKTLGQVTCSLRPSRCCPALPAGGRPLSSARPGPGHDPLDAQ